MWNLYLNLFLEPGKLSVWNLCLEPLIYAFLCGTLLCETFYLEPSSLYAFMCGTFECGTFVCGTFMRNMETSKKGTFMWNLCPESLNLTHLRVQPLCVEPLSYISGILWNLGTYMNAEHRGTWCQVSGRLHQTTPKLYWQDSNC